MQHRGNVVIVTGASSGIGWETAKAFASRGATVLGVARREERLKELTAQCRAESPASSYLAGDLAEPEFAAHVVAEALARHGRVDVLVNNAAVSKHKHVYHLTPADVDHVMQVNFHSAVRTTLAALPAMLDQGGGFIVNVSSFAAKVAPPREAVYAASKAALNSFTEGLWSDLAGSNIHAAIVNPGPIDTEIWEKEDEPVAYNGPKHPPRIVVDAIFEVIEKRRREVTIPKRNAPLVSARLLRRLAPSLLLRGMARMDPVPDEVLSRARERARRREP